MGKCHQCGSLNSIQEVAEVSKSSKKGPRKKAFRLDELIQQSSEALLPTRLDFLDRILGGGLPAGAVVLVAGEPGIGKSTLLFQTLKHIEGRALYISAEESTA